MLLKELEIQGFKSFPDKTKVTFDHGITAVVGPNGSGKSNISDAIRWVLGETSSRQLRGSGKMEDVIFGGTQKRSAMGYASVSLTMDNADRRFDVDNDQVVIRRKYYRSGESEYSVNGQNVRLKDVYELLLDTGLGKDGYSIIGQGKIAEIVASKSAERREIFEEASGIAKYRYRKNEAERRLHAAEENLVRLRDILGELEHRVAPLQAESEKAERFLKLAAQRKQMEVTLWCDTVHTVKENLRVQQRKIDTAQSDYEKQNRLLEQADSQTEQVRLKIQQLTVAVERANAAIRTKTEEIASAESRIAVLENDIRHNNETLHQIAARLQQGESGMQQLKQQQQEYQLQMQQIAEKKQQLEQQAEEKVQQLEQLKEQNQQAGERKGKLNAQLAQLAQQQTRLAVEAAAAESAVSAAQQRLEGLNTQTEDYSKQLFLTRQEQQENSEYLKELTQQLQKLENIQAGLKMKLQQCRSQLDKADEQEQQIAAQQTAAQNRLHLLQELERNMEGYSGSVKAVMKAGANRRLRGIIGPVSSLIAVKTGYETAIETALGAAAQNIVVENETAAKAAISFLKQEKAGRATFLPLDTIRVQTMDTSRLSQGAVVAAELVQAEPIYQKIVQNLLGRIVVVDDLNEASKVARSLEYRNRIVTVDGQVINAGGSYTGGSTARSAGVFSRRQEIEELKAKCEQLDQMRSEAQQATEKSKQQVNVLTAQLNGAQAEFSTAQADTIHAQAEGKRLESVLEQYQAASRLQQAEHQQLKEQIQENQSIFDNAKQQASQLAAQAEELEKELVRTDSESGEFLKQRDRISQQISQANMQALAAEKDIQALQQNLDRLVQQEQQSEQQTEQLKQTVLQTEQNNAECRSQIDGLQNQKQTNTEQIAALEQEIEQATRQRMENEGNITKQAQQTRGLTEQREALSREISRLDEQRKAMETEYDQTVAKLWEEYELTFSQAQELCVPFESAAQLRTQVAELRNKIRALGNVNVSAIDEYAEVKERYEFLHTQVKDVEHGKAELHRMIAELSEEMKQMFRESFERINQNFGRIFAELFGGGTAQLILTEPDDLLTSGVEIQVAPPGKIIKNLAALSGGEQALVAISIYFAILAVNPAPFCILDEIEAALDDVNVTRYAQYLQRITNFTQFIVITHRRGTMEAADVLYGVTMQEDGVSKLLRLDAQTSQATLV